VSKTKRWLDELPLDSSERELLLVGKTARPPQGSIDANWRAFQLAVGTTAAASSGAASGVAGHSASLKVASSVGISKAVAGTGLLVASVKSLALGVALGLAVMGGGGVIVERLSSRAAQPTAVANRPLAPTARRPSAETLPTRSAAEVTSSPAAPATSLPGARAPLVASEPFVSSNSAPNPVGASARPAVAPHPSEPASLAQQARELAELKRLIDRGAAAEALRRLDANFATEAAPVLSEERDALYVQALDRVQRRAEARVLAQRFLSRYPHSPYFETIRRILAE